MRRFPMLLTVVTLVVGAASSLQAQRGNASDVGGRPPLYPPGNANGRGGAPLPGNSPRSVVFGEGLSLGAAASAPGATVISIAPITRLAGSSAALLATNVGSAFAPAIMLEDAILASNGAPAAAQVQRFVASYAGMLNEPTPRRVAASASAFNAMVNSASPAYLTKPPAEFVAAQAVLKELVARTSQR